MDWFQQRTLSFIIAHAQRWHDQIVVFQGWCMFANLSLWSDLYQFTEIFVFSSFPPPKF